MSDRDLDDDELDLLLARGRLSGPTRERMLDAALPRAPRRRRWAWWTSGAAAACAAAVAVVLLVRGDGFRPRGAGGGGAVLDVRCQDGARDRCATGQLLVFQVDGAKTGGALAAWAERSGGGGERVWYFPTATGAQPTVAAQPGRQVLPEAVRLGAEQAPGAWEVHLVLLDSPVARDAIASAKPRASRVVRMEVTR
jgi:hypothetical protein